MAAEMATTSLLLYLVCVSFRSSQLCVLPGQSAVPVDCAWQPSCLPLSTLPRCTWQCCSCQRCDLGGHMLESVVNQLGAKFYRPANGRRRHNIRKGQNFFHEAKIFQIGRDGIVHGHDQYGLHRRPRQIETFSYHWDQIRGRSNQIQ